MKEITTQVTNVDTAIIEAEVKRALEEDTGNGDVTASLVPDETKQASVIAREQCVLCGRDWFDTVFKQVDNKVSIQWLKKDGDPVNAGEILCTIEGNARSLLTAERTALNFLQTLSATASITAIHVDAVKGTSCKILDTRKTIPGLRLAQKYAVHCGGGVNHRSGLYDMILIKENHIIAAGSIMTAVETARKLHPNIPVEVEVETLDELEQAITANVDRILLDNMSPDILKQAVAMNNQRIPLEASGNITLDNIKSVAETGVDYISLGVITKNIRAIDFSMRMK